MQRFGKFMLKFASAGCEFASSPQCGSMYLHLNLCLYLNLYLYLYFANLCKSLRLLTGSLPLLAWRHTG